MTEKGTNNLEVRNTNKKRIVGLLYQRSGMTKQEISRQLGLSMPTVSEILKELSRAGLVREQGVLASSGGRKPALIALVYDAKLSAGIEITQNHIGFVLIDLGENVLFHRRLREPFENSEGYYRRLRDYAEQFLTENHVDRTRLLGFGIALPGVVQADNGLLEYSPTLGVIDLPVAKMTEFMPFQIEAANEANLAGFAELWRMEELSDAVFLSVNKGVGGAVIISDRVYKGLNCRSGEFGHMTIVKDGAVCSCGKRGCLEAYCSTRVLTEPGIGDLEAFFSMLGRGDSICINKWETYLDYLAAGINNIRMIFDTDVIIGGEISRYLENHSGLLREKLRLHNTFGENGDYIHFSRFGDMASAVGAALLLVDKFLNS
jgi:predicted NBD/HSP70 family sugar kinase